MDQGASLELTTKCCGHCSRELQWQWQLDEDDLRASQRFLPIWCRVIVSPSVLSTISQPARQQHGFVNISGRRRARSEAGADDRALELERPHVRVRTAAAVPSESMQIMQRPTEAVLTTSVEEGGSPHQPEAEPATLLEDEWM